MKLIENLSFLDSFSTKNFEKEHIWLFNSAGSFTGNVKYLFLYITKYRPDIFACYITANKKNARYIKSLGYKVCSFSSSTGKRLMKQAGVYVNEQVKESYPKELQHVKILNLFHGVGLKAIEKKCFRESLSIKVAKKYIDYNKLFYRNLCFLVTSPFMEEHFKEHLDLRDDQIIRAGYPRCNYQKEYLPVKTFDHDILYKQGLSDDSRIVLYAPTFREVEPETFLSRAIEDIDQLIKELEKKNILLIIKLHPKEFSNFYFQRLQESIKDTKNILLWDNKLDIYEIFPMVDAAIVDYSSIYYDLIACGVTKIIRYIFDYELEKNTLIYDYKEHTSGIICNTFNELLKTLNTIDKGSSTEQERIKELFWSYMGKNDCDSIVEQTLAFQPMKDLELPTLYSFDVFDTLIARKVLQPKGIFFYVMEKIRESKESFPQIFHTEYVEFRQQAEANVREYIRKDKGPFEITFNAIFDRLQDVYGLTEKQKELLKKWEIEAEIQNVIAIKDKISLVEDLVSKGEQVVLISDMYLPKDTLLEMLGKAHPLLKKLPLFLSSEQGVQKTTQKLYLEVYRHFSPYRFKEWHHFGDNQIADGVRAQKMGIIPTLHIPPEFSTYEQEFVDHSRTYNSYLVAGMLARLREQVNVTSKDYFVLSQIGFSFVPYVAWAIRDALSKGLQTLYFISRDGFFLKKVADEYIELHELPIKTKYIYGSRRAWRLPSMIDFVDEEFFSSFGNLVGVDTYAKLLDSLSISHQEFQEMFFELALNEETAISPALLSKLRMFFKNSKRYKAYLLKKASSLREIVNAYLKQEIDFSEKFGFVEFWGRGYTQTLLGRLLNNIRNNEVENIFYYYRSILPTEGYNVRKNFSTNANSLIFYESIFANNPYSTVTSYKKEGDVIVPEMVKSSYDEQLFQSMEMYLPLFVQKFYELPFLGEANTTEKMCADFSLNWFSNNQQDPCVVKHIAHLKDSVSLWGTPSEYAPAFTLYHLVEILKGKKVSSFTRSLPMSIARSSPIIRFFGRFDFVYTFVTSCSRIVKVTQKALK